jgi:hypothetical protein
MGQKEMAVTAAGKTRIMIYGSKHDGTYIVEFRAAAGEALAISIPRTEAAVIWYFQERMPYGLVRTGRSVRNRWRAHAFSKWSPPTVAHKSNHEGSRDPALGALPSARSGGVLVLVNDTGIGQSNSPNPSHQEC